MEKILRMNASDYFQGNLGGPARRAHFQGVDLDNLEELAKFLENEAMLFGVDVDGEEISVELTNSKQYAERIDEAKDPESPNYDWFVKEWGDV